MSKSDQKTGRGENAERQEVISQFTPEYLLGRVITDIALLNPSYAYLLDKTKASYIFKNGVRTLHVMFKRESEIKTGFDLIVARNRIFESLQRQFPNQKIAVQCSIEGDEVNATHNERPNNRFLIALEMLKVIAFKDERLSVKDEANLAFLYADELIEAERNFNSVKTETLHSQQPCVNTDLLPRPDY